MLRCIKQPFVNKHKNLNQLRIKQFCAFERRRALNSHLIITIYMASNSYETQIIYMAINSQKGTVVWNSEVHLTAFNRLKFRWQCIVLHLGIVQCVRRLRDLLIYEFIIANIIKDEKEALCSYTCPFLALYSASSLGNQKMALYRLHTLYITTIQCQKWQWNRRSINISKRNYSD